jgi:hypothetical protein
MGQALPAPIPTLADTGWTRQALLEALSTEVALPVAAIQIAAQHPTEIERAVAEGLERARTETPDPATDRLVFRGIHILAAARSPGIYRPLISFLRSPPQRLEFLGSTIPDTIGGIIAGVFDGDAGPLKELIMDVGADDCARHAALLTLAFLTFDGRIPLDATEGFLRRFEQENATPPEDMAWDGWMAAAAILGFTQLTPRVQAAFADGRIPRWMSREDDYRRLLEKALERPNDVGRFTEELLGYIEDAVEILQSFTPDEEPRTKAVAASDSKVGAAPPHWSATGMSAPTHNLFKGVGRNDRCPCGSGKKFKKCCGANR